MPHLSATASSISSAILSEAASIGGGLWAQIKTAARHFSRGYSQSLIDISRAVAKGEMTADEGRNSAKAASFFFYMMIAQATQATLNAVQQLLDSVLGLLRDRINGVLPFPVL